MGCTVGTPGGTDAWRADAAAGLIGQAVADGTGWGLGGQAVVEVG
jgi:hypothetical protein